MRILKPAGVAPWPRILQKLRASRETELTNPFPLHVVTAVLLAQLARSPSAANQASSEGQVLLAHTRSLPGVGDLAIRTGFLQSVNTGWGDAGARQTDLRDRFQFGDVLQASIGEVLVVL